MIWWMITSEKFCFDWLIEIAEWDFKLWNSDNTEDFIEDNYAAVAFKTVALVWYKWNLENRCKEKFWIGDQ